MTIAAVPTGTTGLDVPPRGDVLVIKERVAIYNAGPSYGNDPASRLRGSGGPRVRNTARAQGVVV